LNRKPYPSDVSDEEWAFVAPYLFLMKEEAPQREHATHEMFNALRYLVRAGAPWRLLPTNFPPWQSIYGQAMRWMAAGCFEALVHELRVLLRLAAGRSPQPSAVVNRCPHPARQRGERKPSRLRRTQEKEGQQGACGCGYLGPSFSRARYPGQ
jgi:transposase